MIVVIDYGMGNVRSVVKAFDHIGYDAIVSDKKKDLEEATHLILPGVGAFGSAMEQLRKRNLIPIMEQEVLARKKPFLGICLGMQLLAEKSYELGEHRGLGWIAGEVKKLPVEPIGLKVPHVGWNDVEFTRKTALFEKVKTNSAFYFVHSFALFPKDPNVTIGICNYGVPFCAAIERENILATQFHPEKSQKDGLKILENFAEYKGEF